MQKPKIDLAPAAMDPGLTSGCWAEPRSFETLHAQPGSRARRDQGIGINLGRGMSPRGRSVNG